MKGSSVDKNNEKLRYTTPQLTAYGSVGRLTHTTDRPKRPGPGDGWAHDPSQDMMNPGDYS